MIKNSKLDEFEKLNDSIFLEILNSNNKKLLESRQILERIGKRKLYKYVGSVVLPNDHTPISSIEEEVT